MVCGENPVEMLRSGMKWVDAAISAASADVGLIVIRCERWSRLTAAFLPALSTLRSLCCGLSIV